jgi:hypothetical protein
VFPEIPADLTGLSDEELAALRVEVAGFATAARTGDLTDEVMADLARASAGATAIRAEQDARAAAAAERQATANDALAAIDAALAEPEPTPEPEPSATDAASANTDPVSADPPAPAPAVTAAARPRTTTPAVPARPKAPLPSLSALSQATGHDVPPEGSRPGPIRPTMSITAAADIPSRPYNSPMDGIEDIADALAEKLNSFRGGHSGEAEFVKVANVHANMPSERILQSGDAYGNMAKIEAVTSVVAITAAGGACAIATPYYDLMVLAETARPVRDSLPIFDATRGGVMLNPPPQFSGVQSSARVSAADGVTTSGSNLITSASANFSSFDIGATVSGSITAIPAGASIIAVNPGLNQATLTATATATTASNIFTVTRQGSVGYISNAVDAAMVGGSATQVAAGTKPCLQVICPTPFTVTVNAVTRCLEFGTLASRAYPEEVVAWTKLSIAWQARFAEQQLLTSMFAGSIQLTQAAVLGAARDVVPTLIKDIAYLVQHNRINPDTKVHAWLPWTARVACAVDLMFGSGYEMEFYSQAFQQVDAAFANANINITWYWDQAIGTGQYFNGGAAAAPGANVTFPTTVVAIVAPEGSWVFMDGGTWDMGVVRDSGLVGRNAYRLFAESWENVYLIGPESLAITMTVAVNGAASPTGTLPAGF